MSSRLALVCLFTACAHTTTSETEVRARIEERLRVFTDANLAADLDGMVSPFRDDAVMLRPTGTWEGKAAIRAGYERILTQSRVVALQVHTEVVRVSGDRAYELGTIRGEREDASGTRTPTSGRYLTVWRREPDGRWLIEIDSLHFDAPPKP
jgi:uncharacterized protein (TIGR02246 family)